MNAIYEISLLYFVEMYLPIKPIRHEIIRMAGKHKQYNKIVPQNIVNPHSLISIILITKQQIAINDIAKKNNTESEYHVLPFHNFQTGNKIMAKRIVKIIAPIKLSYRVVGGSPVATPKTYQYIDINITVTIATAI